MPDWTYLPLRPIANAVVGERRSQLLAMRFLALLVGPAGGRRWIPAVFAHPPVPAQWEGRFGATVPVCVAKEAVAVLPVQGASIIEIGPVRAEDVDAVRLATAGRRCRVIAAAQDARAATAVAPYVDAVDSQPSPVRLLRPGIGAALAELADPDATVLAAPSVLVEAGPGWFNRVIEAAEPTTPPPAARGIRANPARWPGWLWGALVGAGLIAAGIGAALIALGPVLLWYDRDYLGASVARLHGVNPRLVGFLQHDRLTMAGNMLGIGSLYIGLSVGGLRQGRRWARNALLLSGLVVFLTVFYFLLTGFVEPLHTAVVALLFPMLLRAVWSPPQGAHWRAPVEGPEPERRRALWGQLLMVCVGCGLLGAGATISAVGLTKVFVPTDLAFLATSPAGLAAQNTRLLPFVAHDRAGLGGALAGAGLAVLLVSLWGWSRGERWVWWSLLFGCLFGTAPALAVHIAIGYTCFEHLLPVYALVVAVVLALVLSRPYLTAPAAAPRRP